ncbi:MAG: glycosyltransferase [Thermovirgaceae bacterium]|nr:glycosyltransferase [Synergistales bacterium]HPC76513.1 glycosyltransferase [Synergistales bacterium]HRU91269.1 glycosyltransferase [Thermovirgaceae bacterium]
MFEGVNVHIYPSPIISESRIFKITKALISNNVFPQIAIIGTWCPGLPEKEQLDERRIIIRIKGRPPFFRSMGRSFLGKVLFFSRWYLQVLFLLRSMTVICVNAHSVSVLPLCTIIKKWKKCSLIYDTHELETETTTAIGFRKRIVQFTEKTLIRYVDSTIVVGESIKHWYLNKYNLQKVWVVRNIPSNIIFNDNVGSRRALKKELDIKEQEFLFLYLGNLSDGRGIQHMLEVFSQSGNDRHLLFIGNGVLEGLIKSYQSRFPNIHHLPAVPPTKVVQYASDADVGFCFIDNNCLSYYFSLPNKLFEYLMAGLPVLIGDLPDQRELVETYDCGWILTGSINDFVAFVNSLTREQISEKEKGVRIAQRSLSWANEEKEYLKAINDAMRANAPKY